MSCVGVIFLAGGNAYCLQGVRSICRPVFPGAIVVPENAYVYSVSELATPVQGFSHKTGFGLPPCGIGVRSLVECTRWLMTRIVMHNFTRLLTSSVAPTTFTLVLT